MCVGGFSALTLLSRYHLLTRAGHRISQPSRLIPHRSASYTTSSSSNFLTNKRHRGGATEGGQYSWSKKGREKYTCIAFSAIVVCGGIILTTASSTVAFADTPPSRDTDPTTVFLPATPPYSEMPIQVGHLGNLTAEQEAKLRSFWE